MDTLQEHIGYRFRDPALLQLALSHSSLNIGKNNQRLEFLGDAVLGLIIAQLLYRLFPDANEGELARRHAALVRGETLTAIARDIGLEHALRTASSENAQNASNLEDALEALIGALYLDGGLPAAQDFVNTHMHARAIAAQAAAKDAKTALQEWAQGHGLPIPTYRLLHTEGPAHAPVFTIEASLVHHAPTQAKAPSKRQAEQLAAALLLQQVTS